MDSTTTRRVANKFSSTELFLLTIWLALMVLVMVRGTLALPYLSDDFEHGRLISEIRAGVRPINDLFVVPFHGQTLVLLNLIFWFGTLAGGMSLLWVRLAICAVHVAAAVGCAILVRRWTGSRLLAFFCGTLYAGALGFINEEIWWPSSAIFCLGATFLIFAFVSLGPAANHPIPAIFLLIVAALGLNGVIIAAIALPVYCWFMGQRRAAGVLFGVIVLLLAMSFWQQQRQHDLPSFTLSVRELKLGVWLIATAPLRFFSGFTNLKLPGFRTIIELSPVAWLPLIATVWFMKREYRLVTVVVWLPALIIAFMVGMARSEYFLVRYGPGVLYIADRYYYFFLFPLVVHWGLLLSNFKLNHWGALALVVVLAAMLFGSRAHYISNVPRLNFELTGHALDEGRRLVQTILSSKVRPLLLTDAPIAFDGAHLNVLTLTFLIYSAYPHGMPGVRLTTRTIGIHDSALENSLLNQWIAIPPFCVLDGRLQSTRAMTSYINFSNGSYEENLDFGFSWWERPYRWMGEKASLHLLSESGDLSISAVAPVDQLHKPIHVGVAVNGRSIGAFEIKAPGIHEYRLRAPNIQLDAKADITLTSDVVWHARDILPNSLDDRDLSIALLAVSYGDHHKSAQACPASGV